MAIGKLWKSFGNRTGVAILIAQLFLVLLFIYFTSNYQSSDRCVSCHADKSKMTGLGSMRRVTGTLTPCRVSPYREVRNVHSLLGN